jgi:hypothetical protein
MTTAQLNSRVPATAFIVVASLPAILIGSIILKQKPGPLERKSAAARDWRAV